MGKGIPLERVVGEYPSEKVTFMLNYGLTGQKEIAAGDRNSKLPRTEVGMSIYSRKTAVWPEGGERGGGGHKLKSRRSAARGHTAL